MFKIAIAGLGTVGAGTLQLLHECVESIARAAGRALTVTAVSARDRRKDRGVPLLGEWFGDPVEMARRADADAVVELIGGADGVAHEVVAAAIAAGRHVVTANKALIAHHGITLARAAEERGVCLAFEAAVAGGIPIIRTLREGLASSRIVRLAGILNGTTNFILTRMRARGCTFAEALAEAQRLGYAEADPSFDVDGIDAKHKLAILAALAFGTPVDLDGVHVEGVRHLSPLDIRYAEELGHRIKLLATAQVTDAGLAQRVQPCMVPAASPIAQIEGVLNAVAITGDPVGTITLEGRGAGAGPTASAVVADLIDLARGHRTPAFGVPAAALRSLPVVPVEDDVGEYYLRLMVADQPGALRDVAAALAAQGASVASAIQRDRNADETVPLVLTTHATREGAMRRALEMVALLPSVREVCRIRIERQVT